MNKANLKSYAPKARLDFIKAVTERANVLGISAAGVVPAEVRGDVALIDGREWPAKVAGQRDELIARIKRHGFEQTMDEVAYTWFNRFAALRYMEIHDYLGHGWRVLSSRDGGLPEILRHASELTLPGLNPDRAREMQLVGNQDNGLYKLLLVAQCNELSRVMPFLFERIDDETELLLPENLLRTDSIVAKLVEQVPEEDWQEIEVIGWLYQFYISEKKDQVIGKVVKSEDIPAATQLFTPNWIVQYLVQNSVGRLWLMANPPSMLASQWPYFIQPAEQTPEVQAQLDALIQTRIREDGETLNPETITVLDPACGSGHILVVAYDVLKAIYLERGYQPRSIPRLILEKNLFGLDIDDRAAQLAAFALLMKARADDRRLFNEPPQLNLLSLQESKGLDVDELAVHLAPFGLQKAAIRALLDTFEHAKTFGSLTQVPAALGEQLSTMATGVQHALRDGDLYAQQAAKDVLPLVWQALVLGMHFDAVVANPPYMGSGYFVKQLKNGLAARFKTTRTDLYAIFLEHSFGLLKNTGFLAMICRQDWLFTKSYVNLRETIRNQHTLETLLQLGAGAFEMISGEVTQTAAFVIRSASTVAARSRFIDCSAEKGNKETDFFVAPQYVRKLDEFPERLGCPILYYLSDAELAALSLGESLSTHFTLREGIHTGDNTRFVRLWWEVSSNEIADHCGSVEEFDRTGAKWAPYNKGGSTKRWYWGAEHVLRYDESGRTEMEKLSGHVRPSQSLYFKEGGTWSDVATTGFGVRYFPRGFLFADVGPVVVAPDIYEALALMNSAPFITLAQDVMPNLHFKCGTLQMMPYVEPTNLESAKANARLAVSIVRNYAALFEEQPIFGRPSLLPQVGASSSLASIFQQLSDAAKTENGRLARIELENNEMFAESFGLADIRDWTEIPHDASQISFERSVETQRLLSYCIGCMMGRYGISERGLVYAHKGNVEFDPGRYEKHFPADADGIVPVTDERWFEDDAASRVLEFLRAVYGAESLEENVSWVAESLGIKDGERPDETIRRYLAGRFFKDHLQTYRKRPIYWLFSSGKQGAFLAIVYLHRYNEGTLARMRAEYVVPLIAKMASRLEMLDKDVAAESSAAARTKLQKQIEVLRKKQIELLAYDEKLRHYADMRITLNLDDGVKVNYAKFGDLVAESKVITGGSDE